jgi:hypothetical protein
LRDNTEQHNHDTDNIDRPESSAGLPENIKSIIQTCLVANPLAKPKQIIQEIRKVVPEADEPANLSKRIFNYTARWRKNHYCKDLAAFAQENLGVPIGNLDEVLEYSAKSCTAQSNSQRHVLDAAQGKLHDRSHKRSSRPEATGKLSEILLLVKNTSIC